MRGHTLRQSLSGALLGAAALIGALGFALPIAAHPADEINERDIVRFGPEGIGIETTISVGAVNLLTVWNDVDREHRGVLDDAGRERYGEWLAGGLSLTVDGHPVAVAYEPGSLVMPASLDAFEVQAGDPSGGLVQARFHAAFTTPGVSHDVTLAVQHYARAPGGRRPDMYPLGGDAVNVVMQGGTDVDLRVTTAPSTIGAPAAAIPPVRAPTQARVAALQRLVGAPTPDARYLLFGVCIAVAFGALHALTPGHGKALMAAYLVGTRGRVRDAVCLAGILTITHTGGVIALGIAAVLSTGFLSPTRILPWIEVASGGAILGLALMLLRARLPVAAAHRRLRRAHTLTDDTPGEPPPQDAMPAAFVHEHADGTVHAHGGNPWVGHAHPHDAHPSPRSLALMGLSGAVPCPDALAVLLVAIAAGHALIGIGIVVAFSAGLAAVLIALGLLLVRAGIADRLDNLGAPGRRMTTWVPVVSAGIMVVIGCVTLARAIGALR